MFWNCCSVILQNFIQGACLPLPLQPYGIISTLTHQNPHILLHFCSYPVVPPLSQRGYQDWALWAPKAMARQRESCWKQAGGSDSCQCWCPVPEVMACSGRNRRGSLQHLDNEDFPAQQLGSVCSAILTHIQTKALTTSITPLPTPAALRWAQVRAPRDWALPLLSPAPTDGPGQLWGGATNHCWAGDLRGDASITPVLPLVACLHSSVPVSAMSAQDVPVTLGLGEATVKALTWACALALGNHWGTCSSGLFFVITALAAAWPGLTAGKEARKKSIGWCGAQHRTVSGIETNWEPTMQDQSVAAPQSPFWCHDFGMNFPPPVFSYRMYE